jgi:poly [ADP-ribose] polymerase 10/14/15
MFLCRVVIGEFCLGVQDALVAPARIGDILFDSTVDNVANPSIFVTYHDAQAYPEYLVRFRQ